MDKMIPQFMDVKFGSQKKFESWLKKLTKSKITFSDKGQDIHNMWIHSTGEILHCDFSAWIYNGKFVNINEIKIDEPILVWNAQTSSYDIMHGLVVSDIVTNNEEGD